MWNPYCNNHYAKFERVTVYYPKSCCNVKPKPPISTTTTTSSSTSTTSTTSTSSTSTTTSTSSTSTSTSTSTTTSSTSTSTSTTTSSSTTANPCPNCVDHDVTIGSQIWMGCNLNVDRYADGTLIDYEPDPTLWAAKTTGAWCWYNNDSANGSVYGKLYNWYAVNDPRGLAPAGYHVASDYEWTILTDYLGGETGAGGLLKKVGVGLCTWNSPNTGATNTTGFTALPGGYRLNNGSFYDISFLGYWWSSTVFNTTVACSRILFYNASNVYRSFNIKSDGFSVRCIKD